MKWNADEYLPEGVYNKKTLEKTDPDLRSWSNRTPKGKQIYV